MDFDVGRDGEEGYELREMGSDGQGGWEEGGVDGSAGGGVSATAAAMEQSIDRSIDRIESKAIKRTRFLPCVWCFAADAALTE